jgi:phenylalanyl-tRNA synthetase beta chain
MKVSRTWLQTYFNEVLPSVDVIAEKLTFGAFEIEGIQGDDVLDVKVLPDRASYALCHLGIAKEISAVLDIEIKRDPLEEPLGELPKVNNLFVEIEDATKCSRYMATRIRGVKVVPSPQWLRSALESVGQRSINNIVDATNYVMLSIGQPLHAYDASKLLCKDGTYSIKILSTIGEGTIATLDTTVYKLPEGTLIISDKNRNDAIGIAGIKGGLASKIDESTTDIIIESANFDGSIIRKTSQFLKLWTDASLRFQNKISPELCAYGMRDVVALILEIAGGEVVDSADSYPHKAKASTPVSITLEKITSVLGVKIEREQVARIFNRLGFVYTQSGDEFSVLPSFTRRDTLIREDLIEEVGRIFGYEHIPAVALTALGHAPDQEVFSGIECIKDFLIDRGFSEISTQSFSAKGDIALENPLQKDKPYLRTTLSENMKDALTRALTHAPRVLGTTPVLKLFEIGNTFTKEGEYLLLCLGYRALSGKNSVAMIEELRADLTNTFGAVTLTFETTEDTISIQLSKEILKDIGEGYTPKKIALGRYTPFSLYPAALRDIAVWTPRGTEASEVVSCIEKEAGDLLARIDLFDRFEKDERISYAFRLVLESYDHTLSDSEIDPLMERITGALNQKEGYEVRA